MKSIQKLDKNFALYKITFFPMLFYVDTVFFCKKLGEEFGRRNIYPMNSFGERLKVVRGDRSQAAFAKELGIPQVTLSNYETNKTEPKFKLLQAIVSIFCINIEWLMIGSGPMRTGDLTRPHEASQNIEGMSAGCCTHCAKLERVEEERRELNAENRRLWKENGELRERCATLTERMACSNSGQ